MTKGPWYYDGEDMDSEAAASWDGNGYEIFTRDCAGFPDIPIAGEVLTEEDARLIAAAPDLLSSLKSLVEQVNYNCISKTMALEAIAKAEGTD